MQAPEDAQLAYEVNMARLVSFYELHNPEKAGEVEATLGKFKGRYEVLFKKLNQKYKVKG